ncbi:MAG TPA: MBL fold metallo-hydrolase [Methanoregulaceae archaeon]|nr:MBL fold metallo-hydrolase [Methanoregulaceae archaeon]
MPVQWIPGDPVFANSYLTGEVLVDAGVMPMAVSRYKDRIRKIVLTHCHYDHTAYVKEIAHMCRAEVFIHKLDATGLVDDNQSLSMHFASHPPGIVPDNTLKDGDTIDDLLIIHTPGHTPGSICIFNEATGDLISGDTVFTDGGFGRFDFPGGDRNALARSIDRLSALGINGLYPGHGEPTVQDGARHVLAARELLSITFE